MHSPDDSLVLIMYVHDQPGLLYLPHMVVVEHDASKIKATKLWSCTCYMLHATCYMLHAG